MENPIGKIAFVFYRENNSYFVLGSFAFTDRIIFFPGLNFSRLIYTPDGSDVINNAHNLEHFTLERDFSRWHIKTDSEIWYPAERTKRVNSNTFLWFVMGIPNASKLEPMPRTQEFKLSAPHMVDLNRRQGEMKKSMSPTFLSNSKIGPY
jgi:hypothetical protein